MLKTFRSFLLVTLFLLLFFNVSATSIRCINKEYAGKELVFYRLDDPVSNSRSEAFTLKFDRDGTGSVSVDVKQTTYFFSDFGVYRGMLFVETGKTIELKLPPLREKSFVDEKNPYFQPVSFWFVTESGDQLNDKVSGFEQQLNYLTDKHFNELYLHQSKAAFDSVSTAINQMVPSDANETLVQHKTLKLKMLEADIFRMRPESYAAVFNEIDAKYWLHPAFMEALNKTFDRQLSFSAQAIGGDVVRIAVAAEDVSGLTAYVEKKFKLKGQTTNIVLLKMLHDGFYSGEFNQQNIQNLVSADRFTKSPNKVVKTTAADLLEKFSFLAKGTKAPAICLNNLEGEEVCTNAGKDKFKYIIFADAETAVSREHLKYLSRIDELFPKHLEIFVVLRNTDHQSAGEFFKDQDIPAQILWDENGTYIEKYKIRSFPQCILLDEEHRVVFENAKAPLDGFEEQFGTWLRNELFQRQRNQSR